MDVICSHVANGGTLITLCEVWGLQFGDISNWIHLDKEREKRYISSLNDRGEWGVERILQELRSIGLADIRQAFNEDGSLKNTTELPESIARSIVAIEVDELYAGRGNDKTQIGWTKRIKFSDKLKALELLGKNLKLWVERLEVGGGIRLEDIVTGRTPQIADPMKALPPPDDAAKREDSIE